MAELSEADKKSIFGAAYQPPAVDPVRKPSWLERLVRLMRPKG